MTARSTFRPPLSALVLRKPLLVALVLLVAPRAGVQAQGYERVFADDFTDNAFMWPTQDDAQVRLRVADGFYHLEHHGPGVWATWAEAPFDPASDYAVSLQIQKTRGADEAGYGLLWNMDETGSSYLYFVVTGSGAWMAGGTGEGGYVELHPWEASEHVLTDGSPNVLMLQRRQGAFGFYVNGQLVGTAMAPPSLGQQIGMLVSDSIDVRADWIEVARPIEGGGTAVERALAAAEAGDAGAQMALALAFMQGQGVPQDAERAVYWVRRAAEQGLAEAQNTLGVWSLNGTGVPQDVSEAARLFRLAADQGHTQAQFWVGMMYATGNGVPADRAAAIRWLERAAEAGMDHAQYQLSALYTPHVPYSTYDAMAAEWDLLNSFMGDASADSTAQRDRVGFEWCRRAAEQGLVEAQNMLGVRYSDGLGVRRDSLEALRWYRLAADQGDAWGQYNVGEEHFRAGSAIVQESSGPDWKPESGQSFEDYLNARTEEARSGDHIAEHMADDRERRARAEPYFAESLRWFRLAAEQGVALAQYKLGAAYGGGSGVPKDVNESTRWFQRAAEQGLVEAQVQLALRYELGTGVAQNRAEAIRLYRLAAAQGNALAKSFLDQLEERGD